MVRRRIVLMLVVLCLLVGQASPVVAQQAVPEDDGLGGAVTGTPPAQSASPGSEGAAVQYEATPPVEPEPGQPVAAAEQYEMAPAEPSYEEPPSTEQAPTSGARYEPVEGTVPAAVPSAPEPAPAIERYADPAPAETAGVEGDQEPAESFPADGSGVSIEGPVTEEVPPATAASQQYEAADPAVGSEPVSEEPSTEDAPPAVEGVEEDPTPPVEQPTAACEAASCDPAATPENPNPNVEYECGSDNCGIPDLPPGYTCAKMEWGGYACEREATPELVAANEICWMVYDEQGNLEGEEICAIGPTYDVGPCAEPNCGVEHVAPGFTCDMYTGTYRGDVVGCHDPAGEPDANGCADIVFYDTQGRVLGSEYECGPGVVPEDPDSGYSIVYCGADNCGIADVPPGFTCQREESGGFFTEGTTTGYNCSREGTPELIAAKEICYYDYDENMKLESAVVCLPPQTGGKGGEEAADDAQDTLNAFDGRPKPDGDGGETGFSAFFGGPFTGSAGDGATDGRSEEAGGSVPSGHAPFGLASDGVDAPYAGAAGYEGYLIGPGLVVREAAEYNASDPRALGDGAAAPERAGYDAGSPVTPGGGRATFPKAAEVLASFEARSASATGITRGGEPKRGGREEAQAVGAAEGRASREETDSAARPDRRPAPVDAPVDGSAGGSADAAGRAASETDSGGFAWAAPFALVAAVGSVLVARRVLSE